MKVHTHSARARVALTSTVAAFALLSAMPAFAQTAEPAPAQDETSSDDAPAAEIVVTGTQLRGVAPVGTNVVGVDKQQIQATGATSTNDVLGKIPQISSNFNRVNVSSLSDPGTTISRPNIRNLGASGANSTLVLVDGHRVVGAGVLQTTPDPDIVPPGLIERIEIVPDGGSSIYGSDAIGGVINLITRKRFNGLEVAGRYGFADDYHQLDANVTAGKDWGSGSLYASYVYTQHDAIFGRDRDYVQSITKTNACAPGTVTVGTVGSPTAVNYALPGLAANTVNTCDVSDNASFVPDERRHSVFGGLFQQLNPSLSVDVKAFYTFRQTSPYNDQFRSAVTITSANPYFRPLGGATSETVAFSYSPVYGLSNKSTTRLNEWGVTPSLTADLGGGWQLRVLGNYGRSSTELHTPALNDTLQTAALGGTTTATALNPYDPTQTNAGVLAGIRNYETLGRSNQELGNGRAILDGSLFTLPGGDVRVAVGTEINWESYKVQTGNHVPGSLTGLTNGRADRTVKAVFGEIAIPIFGAGNGFGGMQSLTLSASGRYDHYSDFGGTFNPKFGATWKPVDWISIRGNYGTSFNAPSLADTGAAATNVTVAPLAILNSLLGVSLINPASPPTTVLQSVVLVTGGNVNLKPQEADTYSLGIDVKPPFIPGLTLNATYYNVNFTNQISIAFGPNFFAPGFGNYYTLSPTLAQAQARAGSSTVSGAYFNGLGFAAATNLPSVFSAPFAPYILVDLRRNNLGSVKLDGIDFNFNYLRPTGFGSINAGVAGSYALNRRIRTTATAPDVDALASDNSRFNMTANLGATSGGFSAQATLYHTAGYKLGTPVGGQTRVNSFNVVDLALVYDVRGAGVFKDLSFSLNVNNVLDQDPPFYRNGFGYANGSTLGRLVQFGVRKKF